MKSTFVLVLVATALRAQSPAVMAALSTGTYFPLDVGDRWVYRIDDRTVTASYQTWRVDHTQILNGKTYSVIAIEGPGTFYYEAYFRADASGRIYQPGGTDEILFLDPTTLNVGGGELILTQRLSRYQNALGTFPDAVTYQNGTLLIMETGILARGIGLLTSTSHMLSGSSGGFTQGRTLVEANVAGGIHFPAPSPSVQLGVESLLLDVTGKQVTNCAIPCYFVACSIAGADPPNTYKPCAQARIGLANWPAGQSRSVRVQLVAPSGTIAYDNTVSVGNAPAEAVTFLQLPLYSAPNQPLAPGTYQVMARTTDGTAQAAVMVKIQ